MKLRKIEEVSVMGNSETKDITKQLQEMEQRITEKMENMERGLKQELEEIKRQVELQDLSFRALVKAAKAGYEVEEELEGTYVREGTGFNTRRTKWVRDPLA